MKRTVSVLPDKGISAEGLLLKLLGKKVGLNEEEARLFLKLFLTLAGQEAWTWDVPPSLERVVEDLLGDEEEKA